MNLNFFDIVKEPLKLIEGEAKDVVTAVIPPAALHKYGALIHTLGGNLLHDAGAAAKEFGQEAFAEILSAMETTGQRLAPLVLSGKLTVSQAADQGATALKNEAVQMLVPSLKTAAESTLKNWLPIMVTTAMMALQGNPITALPPPQAASPAAS